MPVGFDTETALIRALDKRKGQTVKELAAAVGSHTETTRLNLNALAKRGLAVSERKSGAAYFQGTFWKLTDAGMEERKARKSVKL